MGRKVCGKVVHLLLALVLVALAAGTASAQAVNRQDERLNFDRSIKETVDNFRILRTTQKSQMNDYVTRVFELKNARCMEMLPYVRTVVTREGGTAATMKYTDPQTKKERNWIQVVCPRFQLAGIEELIKAYDLPGMISSPGDTRFFYRMQHRAAADVNAILTQSELSPDGRSAVDVATNTIYFRDSASDFGRGLAVVKFMDVPVPQVELEVEIFELDKNEEARLGLYWDAWKNALGGGAVTYANDFGLAEGYEAVFGIGATTAAQFLHYLVERGAARVVTRTRVSVQNAETATISSLQRIPYQAYTGASSSTTPVLGTTALAVLQEQVASNQPGGSNQTSSADPGLVRGEKSVGIYMTVTPMIGVQTLSARITVTVNSLVGFTKLDVPIITERRTKTTATLTPGKIFMLGGIDKETVIEQSRGIPFLGSIPILGKLFSYDTDVARKTVLVVTIKPTIKNQLLYKALGLEGAARPSVLDIQKDQQLILEPHRAANPEGEDLLDEIGDLGPKLRWGHTQWGCECE